MYEKINITENTLKVLSMYTRGYDKEHYIREVSRIMQISPRTSQLILSDLEKKGILTSKQRGKTLLFSLNKQNPIAKAYVKLAEDYKLVAFLSENNEVKYLLEELGEIDDEAIFAIFGSYAKGTRKKDSDFDLFAVSHKTSIKDKIKALEGKHSFRISVKMANKKTFEKKDVLTTEVLENHVCLQNSGGLVRLGWE